MKNCKKRNMVRKNNRLGASTNRLVPKLLNVVRLLYTVSLFNALTLYK